MRTFAIFRPDRALPLIFLGFTVFALCFQGSFYLFDYRNGDTAAPTYFKLLKDAGWLITLSMILWVGLAQKRWADALLEINNWILLSFCLLVALVKIIEWLNYGTTSVMLLTIKNLILYAAVVPALSLLSEELKGRIIRQVIVAFVVVAFAQVIFAASVFIFYPERSFWVDDPYQGFNPFVGLFANPNRFGLFLNLCAAVLCTVLVTSMARTALVAAAGLLILAISIFYTAALSQLIVYFGLLSYATAIAALTLRWRSFRLLCVAVTSAAAIGFITINLKNPLPDETHTEAELAHDLRNLASLALRGRTTDGEPFRFTSDSFLNRGKEISDLLESVGIKTGWSFKSNAVVRERTATRPLQQKLFGVPEQMAPASQSQFAYIYFRYGIVGLTLFAAVLGIPAACGFFSLMAGKVAPLLLIYHLSLIVFLGTFLGDNGLLDFPTGFLLFFLVFANQHLAPFRIGSRVEHTLGQDVPGDVGAGSMAVQDGSS